MSRSVHTTRRELRETRLDSYRDAKLQAEEVARIETELVRKRRIKVSAVALDVPSGLAGPVPIRVMDEGKPVVHPATAQDIEAVIERLPVGVLNGLSEIVLGLGAQSQLELGDSSLWDPDPVLGRVGHELLPGVHAGWVYGTYSSWSCSIQLYGFVEDPSLVSPMPMSAFLKLHILSTFVHEVAHHLDYTQRVARRRWRADETEKKEDFASERQWEWTLECVVPYLEHAYPEEVASLLDWIERHGKVRFSLGELVLRPREAYVSSMEQCLGRLVRNVREARTELETLLDFVVDLKIVDKYTRAHEALDYLLNEAPEHEEGLTLRLQLWNFEQRHEDALELAGRLIKQDPNHREAWNSMARVYAALQQWDRVVEVTTQCLGRFSESYDALWPLELRCMAYWQLGMQAESDRDLNTLRSLPLSVQRVKRILKTREAITAS